MRRVFISVLAIVAVGCSLLKGVPQTDDATAAPEDASAKKETPEAPKHVRDVSEGAAAVPEYDPTRLTDNDYREVAARLGVDVAAIKAVVDIEAGTAHQGFWTEGKPIINFDLSMYQKAAAKRKINLNKYHGTHAVIFAKPNTAKYGSQQAAQQARLDAAMTIDPVSAIEGTFWGMFQIGGFNWKLCKCTSHEDFVAKMSQSERMQLELFANFIESSGMLPYLRQKNWAAFAQRYNGPSYASRGYHTRLASAYRKHGGK